MKNRDSFKIEPISAVSDRDPRDFGSSISLDNKYSSVMKYLNSLKFSDVDIHNPVKEFHKDDELVRIEFHDGSRYNLNLRSASDDWFREVFSISAKPFKRFSTSSFDVSA